MPSKDVSVHRMMRTKSSLLAGLLLLACGPAPKPKPATSSVLTDGPQAESTEWLYATPGSSGVVKQECKVVAQALEDEQNCGGDLCRHPINLAEDWLRTCREFEKAKVAGVEQLLAGFKQRAQVSGGDCAFRGIEFIDKGCPEAADCALAAQNWATKCSEMATPLVVSMIEKQVERRTQTPITLNTTSCTEVLSQLSKSPTCSNDFECEEKLAQLKQYQDRCVDENQPLPLDQALQQALLLQAAKQHPPPFLVSEAKFAPEKGRLMLEDASGFVVAVGEHPAPNVNLMIKTLRESEYTLSVVLARVFAEKGQRPQLRLGVIDTPDPETFFRRYQSLQLQGQAEAVTHHVANAAISQLNEVVKNLDRQRVAVAGLIQTLGASPALQNDEEFQSEVAKADKHLVKVFERLALDKRLKLPKSWVRGEKMRDRVAYARRSWQQPFADVNLEGDVELGAVNPAILVNVQKLLPQSFKAYRENMDGTVGKALRALETEHEQHLLNEAQTRAKQCEKQRAAVQRQEQQLLACAFGMQACAEEKVETAGAELDQALTTHTTTRYSVEFALLQLEKPPTGPLLQLVASCRE